MAKASMRRHNRIVRLKDDQVISEEFFLTKHIIDYYCKQLFGIGVSSSLGIRFHFSRLVSLEKN